MAIVNGSGEAVAAVGELVLHDSFEAFYRTSYRRALRLAVVLTGSGPAAEDLVQDVMADAHRRWDRLSTYDDPGAWLRRAILNRTKSRRRRLVVAARGMLGLIAAREPRIELAPPDWELWHHVAALPPRQAQLVALVHIEDMTVTAAAKLLGIAVTTAQTHLSRATARLEQELADWRTP